MVTQQLEENDVYKALADSTRRAILDTLRSGGQPAGRLASRFPVSRPAISRHLRVLREAGLVMETVDGREHIYELNTAPLREVDEWLEAYRVMWKQRLGRLKNFVEGRERKRRHE